MARKGRLVALGAAVGIGIAIITRWREQVFGLLRRGRTQAADPPVAPSSWPEAEVAAQITEGLPEEQAGPPSSATLAESERVEEEQPTEESAKPETP